MYQLIKLYFRLFFKNNKGLLIILILLFTSFSTLYINLHQTKINRDTTTQIYAFPDKSCDHIFSLAYPMVI